MSPKDCIFCKIARGELDAEKEYEDGDVIAFHDINPQAPIHLLIVPKKHINEFASLEDFDIWTKMAEVAQKLISKHELGKKGYRLVNNGAGAAIVDHLHLHLLGDVSTKRAV